MRRAAIIAVALTVGFLGFMDWVPTPLNPNIAVSTPAERLPGTLIHGLMGAGVIVAQLVGRRWLILAGAVWYSLVLISAISNWWVPYVLGIHPGEISPAAYHREYGDNLTVLPPIADHPVIPDVQHCLIHLGLLLSCVFSWLAFRATRPAGHPGWSRVRGGSPVPGSPPRSRP